MQLDAFIDYLASFSGIGAYLIILGWLLLCGLGVPVPEDIALFAAGLLAYNEAAEIYTMIIVAMFGVMAGDSIIFGLGRRYGLNLIQQTFLKRFLTPESLAKAQEMFQKRGNAIFFFVRFAPGFRAPVFFSAGALKVPYRIFAFYDGLAALISVPTIVYTTYYFGDRITEVIGMFRRTNEGLFAAIVLVVAVILFKRYRAKKTSKP